MEIVSNGVYRSIEHRATVNSTKERLSIATFYSSNLDSELGPAHSLVGPDNPAVFRRMPIEEYFKEFFAQKLNAKKAVLEQDQQGDEQCAMNSTGDEQYSMSIGKQWKEFLDYNDSIGFIFHDDAKRLDRAAKNRYNV
ncbi:hypothetical protein RHGRI_037755 [Rhododendron griersonianum]|uniref:Isopenicillin N synthase-like Fe(2+) 2OG dioxygenase domain-containing protein n=1 Tax=Rhododendron griersonianum TaxID=479676 RepID=A0AAV6HW40_9ERIC|nr:hypothetical protein RHGRI_037755 [Rhododendron griersonianum]